MKSFLGAFFGTLAAFAVVLLGLLGVLARRDRPPRVMDGSTLILAVGDDPSDYPGSTVSFGGPSGTSQTELLSLLEKAAVDDRVSRVVLNLAPFQGGYAKAEELRDAIHRFRGSGKPAIAWSAFMTPKTYSVAAACDSIYMVPDGPFVFPGFSSTRSFYKEALDKLGVTVDVDRIESYKSAAEATQRRDMSTESREMAARLLGDQVDALRAALEKDRKLSPADFDSLLRGAVFLAGNAESAGWIDGVRHYEDLVAVYGGHDLKRPRLVSAEKYVDVTAGRRSFGGGRKIAVVHGQGVIASGRSAGSPVFGDILGSDSIIRELRRVASDAKVAAIVLRLDTPGGETWASDAIGNEVRRVAAKKPVVVSMGDACASGGYSIAYRATKVVALPSTLTGSIGSFTGKANLRGLYEKLGITHDGVDIGPHAGLIGVLRSWTPEEKAIIRARHWESYNAWIADIAKSRGLSTAELDSMARGRVWTGREALPRKLVDRLGGLNVAIAEARAQAGIDSTEKLRIEHFPKPRRPLEALLDGDWDALASAAAGRAAENFAATLVRLSRVESWAIMDVPAP